MKTKVIASELTVKFHNGKSFTYKRVIAYEYNGDKFHILTKNLNKTFTRILDKSSIKSIQEKLIRSISQPTANELTTKTQINIFSK